MAIEDEPMQVVREFFEVCKRKDLAGLRKIQSGGRHFSYFGDVPPYDLKDYESAVMLEELRIVGISDYDYRITGPSVSVFGQAAVAAFGLEQTGMLVDNKSYTGTHMKSAGRATFVLIKEGQSWKIVHVHLSQIPS